MELWTSCIISRQQSVEVVAIINKLGPDCGRRSAPHDAHQPTHPAWQDKNTSGDYRSRTLTSGRWCYCTDRRSSTEQHVIKQQLVECGSAASRHPVSTFEAALTMITFDLSKLNVLAMRSFAMKATACASDRPARVMRCSRTSQEPTHSTWHSQHPEA